MKVSKITIIMNLILFILKLFAGIFAKSGAMVSDAIHTASDVFSTFIVIIGVNISHKKADSTHQYGHERLESVASIVLSVMLAVTGMFIGLNGLEKIFGGNYGELEIPGYWHLLQLFYQLLLKSGCIGIPEVQQRKSTQVHLWQMPGTTARIHCHQ